MIWKLWCHRGSHFNYKTPENICAEAAADWPDEINATFLFFNTFVLTRLKPYSSITKHLCNIKWQMLHTCGCIDIWLKGNSNHRVLESDLEKNNTLLYRPNSIVLSIKRHMLGICLIFENHEKKQGKLVPIFDVATPSEKGQGICIEFKCDVRISKCVIYLPNLEPTVFTIY